MKRFALLVIIFLSSTLWVISQEVSVPSTIGNLNMDDPLAIDKRYAGVKGTPYIFETFQKAILYASNEPPLGVDYLNYNAYARELCYKGTEEEDAYVLNKLLIDSFHVFSAGDTLKFTRLSLEGLADHLYMEQIMEGEIRLYNDHGKSFNEADYVDPYSADRRYDEFKDSPVYYIQFEENEEIIRLEKSKKQNAGLFKPREQQMLRYFKTEKTGFRNKQDLVAMVNYYKQIKN